MLFEHQALPEDFSAAEFQLQVNVLEVQAGEVLGRIKNQHEIDQKVKMRTWRYISQEEGKSDPVSSNQDENEHEQDDKYQKHWDLVMGFSYK